MALSYCRFASAGYACPMLLRALFLRRRQVAVLTRYYFPAMVNCRSHGYLPSPGDEMFGENNSLNALNNLWVSAYEQSN